MIILLPYCFQCAQNDKYVDKLRYKEAQPEKKKGFLTSDFSKRDEFTNTIRTEQWREQLKVGLMFMSCHMHTSGTDIPVTVALARA